MDPLIYVYGGGDDGYIARTRSAMKARLFSESILQSYYLEGRIE